MEEQDKLYSVQDLLKKGGNIMMKLEDGIYETGWFFNKAYWRQGYAYESCKAVMDYSFNELEAHKIFLEGIQRSQVRDNHGNWAILR